MRSSLLAWLLLATAACGSATTPPRTPQDAPASDAAAARRPPDAAARTEPAAGAKPLPTSPSFAAVRRICAAECAGPLASFVVLRDAAGEARRVRFDGDLDRCSHPPRIYFDAEGNELLAIPEEPVEPGSARQKELDAKQAAMLDGLVEAERLGCGHPELCEPSKTEGFRSELPCRADGDCMSCQCQPTSRPEWERRGGASACTGMHEECIATNAVCCDGKCMLAR